MSEELQPILDHIRREGVDKARAEAESILKDARTKAKAITEKAAAEAQSLRDAAQEDAKAFNARAEASLKQAARDLILSIEQQVTKQLERLLQDEVTRVLDDATLTTLIVEAVRNTIREQDPERDIAVLLPDEKLQALRHHLLGKLREGLGEQAVELRAAETQEGGFSIRTDNGRVEHDFRAGAITEALARLLRPGLVELLRS